MLHSLFEAYLFGHSFNVLWQGQMFTSNRLSIGVPNVSVLDPQYNLLGSYFSPEQRLKKRLMTRCPSLNLLYFTVSHVIFTLQHMKDQGVFDSV